MSIAFNNSFSPRSRAISSSNFLRSIAARLSSDNDAFSMLKRQRRNSIKWNAIRWLSGWSISTYHLVCFSCNIWTYSQAFERMPPFDCPSMAAMLKRPLSPISVLVPSAGIMLPNFMIQWLILSRRLPKMSKHWFGPFQMENNENTHVQLHYEWPVVCHNSSSSCSMPRLLVPLKIHETNEFLVLNPFKKITNIPLICSNYLCCCCRQMMYYTVLCSQFSVQLQ